MEFQAVGLITLGGFLLAREKGGWRRARTRERRAIMFKKGFAWGMVAAVIVVLGYWGVSAGAKGSGKQTCNQVPAETVADYVHAALQADRTFYTTHVVERMQAKGIVTASENWRETNTLPLPAQVLNESNQLVGSRRTRIGYRLISLLAVNKPEGAEN